MHVGCSAPGASKLPMNINARVKSQYNSGTVKRLSPDGKFAAIKWDGFGFVGSLTIPVETLEQITPGDVLANEPQIPGIGANHANGCDGVHFDYSGESYSRVRVCACGAEDHDPEV